MATPTRLQQDIAERILQMVREDGLEAGAWLNENSTQYWRSQPSTQKALFGKTTFGAR